MTQNPTVPAHSILTHQTAEELALKLLKRCRNRQRELEVRAYALAVGKWIPKVAVLILGALQTVLNGKDAMIMGMSCSVQVISLLMAALVVVEAWDISGKLPLNERCREELAIIEQQLLGELDRVGTRGISIARIEELDEALNVAITRWSILL